MTHVVEWADRRNNDETSLTSRRGLVMERNVILHGPSGKDVLVCIPGM